MRRWLLLAVVLAPLAAQAQEETRLSLSETGTALRLPDQPIATLRVEARAASAAAAQAQVNRAMAAAMEEARKVFGVVASTGRYGTHRVDDNKAWLATQALNLRGGDGAALADLVGALQGRGLALDELGWRLSPEQQREARDEATRAGLAALRERASMIAAELGLNVRRIDRVAVDSSFEMPFRQAAPAAMSARAAPPVSVPQEATVSSRISAEILLAPR
jgi:predicted secreted protein